MKVYKVYRALFIIVVLVSFILLASEGSGSKSFNANKGGTIELNTNVGDVKINTWDKSEAYVQIQGLDKNELEKVKMEQVENLIRISYKSGWGRMFSHVKFDITIPSQFNLNLNTAGGDINIGGSINGEVIANTSGGDIRVADVIGGPVKATTSGGDIFLQKLIGDGSLRTAGGDIKTGKVDGKLQAHTSGGDIEVESVSKSLEAKTAGGDIKAGNVGGEAKVSTSGGDIYVEDIKGDAEVSTSGGNIKVGKVEGKATIKTAGGDIILNGAKGKAMLKTAGGDITIKNVFGSIEAKTAGGNIEAELIPDGKEGSKLVSAGGEIKLYVDEKARATIEATIKLDGFSLSKRNYIIKSEFPKESYITSNDEIHAVYKLNGGGVLIELVTSNSDIEILKLRK